MKPLLAPQSPPASPVCCPVVCHLYHPSGCADPLLFLSNSRSTLPSRSLRLGRPSVTRTGVSPCLSSDSWSPATSVAAPFLTTVHQNGGPSPPSPAPSPPRVPQRYFSLTYCILRFSLNTSVVISCLPICFLSTFPDPSCHWNFGF